MTDDPKRRLYKALLARTDEQLLLDRMRLHGFWPKNQPIPPDPPEEANERARIEAEIDKLRRKASRVKDPDKALAEERVRRWEESKKRRALAKVERAAELAQRREAYRAHAATTIVHAGSGVSARLSGAPADKTKLLALDLPVLDSALDLANALGISLPKLRWLTFHRRSATLVHYHRYEIPKRSGGSRRISAPKPALAAAQQIVLERILERVSPEFPANGFVKKRSIVSNALPHSGQRVVVNVDLEDFFPTVGFRRVRGLFKKLGYGDLVATLLGLLCTEPPRAPADLDGRRYFVALGERVLPQGACTSPAITNLVCRRLDRRMVGLARTLGFKYTRYADDLTFSSDRGDGVARLLYLVRRVLEAEGFRENQKKTRVMRRGRRQEVTGVVVNERPTLSRKERRRLRAILHNAAKSGLDSQNRDGHPRFAEHLAGRVAYAKMIDARSAAPLAAALERALAKT